MMRPLFADRWGRHRYDRVGQIKEGPPFRKRKIGPVDQPNREPPLSLADDLSFQLSIDFNSDLEGNIDVRERIRRS